MTTTRALCSVGCVALLGLATWLAVRAWAAFPDRLTSGLARQEGLSRPVAPPDKLSWELETDAFFDEQGTALIERNRPFFADFAWKQFIALNWPALATGRGKPDTNKAFGASADHVVWGTWKTMDELFPPNAETVPPTPWDTYGPVLPNRPAGAPEQNPQRNEGLALTHRTKFLSQVAQLEDVNQTGFPGVEEVNRPLIAQNRTFVHYEIRVNQVQYDWILCKQLYLRKNLPPDPQTYNSAMQFPDQSVIVKAAWRELSDREVKGGRYYHIPAKVAYWKNDHYDYLDRTVGLVGLNIIHKTPKRPRLIWAAFEHVDNTELGPGGTPPPSFNSEVLGMEFTDPRALHPPPRVKPHQPLPDPSDPLLKVVEVARLPVTVNGVEMRYHPVLEKVNESYWKHPQIQGTPWEHYRLVAIQWPPKEGGIFPPHPVANSVIETYTQNLSTCMTCHTNAAYGESVFYLHRRAVGPAAAGADPHFVMKKVGAQLAEQRKNAMKK